MAYAVPCVLFGARFPRLYRLLCRAQRGGRAGRQKERVVRACHGEGVGGTAIAEQNRERRANTHYYTSNVVVVDGAR